MSQSRLETSQPAPVSKLRSVMDFPKWSADWCIRFYQAAISPMLGQNCRFTPTCSQYAREAIAKYGVIRGGWKAFWRIMRCNRFFPGGSDPVD